MGHGFKVADYRFRSPLRAVYAALLTCLVLLAPAMASATQSLFYSTQESRHGDLSAFTKWTRLMPRYAIQKAEAEKCSGDECAGKDWNKLLGGLSGKSTIEQMEAVNSFFNNVNYVEDSANYGQEDYWATPYEFMKRGGDCEDYAIAKYISLKRLGVPEGSMRIIILQDNNLGGIMHAVLEVRLKDKRYLLDNQSKTVTAEEDIFHYRPIYAINRSAWWTYQ